MAITESILARQPAFAAAARAASQFFAWWGRELATFVPDRLRAWWRGADQVVALSLTSDKAELAHIARNRRQPLGSVDLVGEPRQHGHIRALLRDSVGARFRLVLCLPPERVLRRTIVLPLAVAENLGQTLAFELDRYTPFKPDNAYFAYRVLERNQRQNQLRIEFAVVPRPIVDEAVATAIGLGLRPDGATLAEELIAQGGDFLDFLPTRSDQPRPAAATIVWRVAFATLALMLAAGVLGIPIWQKHELAISLLTRVAETRTAAQDTDRLRDQLDKLVANYNFIPDKKWAGPSVLMVLDELTKRLPDDTFVLQFDYDGKTIQVIGETASSSGLVDTLEASPLFKEVSFKSQLTKIQGTSADRFHLGATLKNIDRPRKPPETQSAVATPPPATGNPGIPPASKP